MRVIYPDISTIIGFNPHNPEKPFWMQRGFNFLVYFDDGSKRVYRIPSGFESDGCTLKWKLLRLVFGCPHTPEYLIGSITHDWFCCNRHLIDRASASEIMYILFIREGVPEKKAKTMKLGVELFQKYWRKWE
jgi:hypothetical protein